MNTCHAYQQIHQHFSILHHCRLSHSCPARVGSRPHPSLGFSTAARSSKPSTNISHPEFFPPETTDIQEPAAIDMISRMDRITVNAASLTCPVETAYIGPAQADSKPKHADQAPVLLLHGFDSSSLEFRRLWPVLEESVETWAVDLVGWGFSNSGAAKHQKEMKLGPKQKRDHLYSFWQQKIKRPMVLVGTSLGGAIAMDFALEYPEAVEKLVLVDAQGFIDGLGPWRVAPRWLINLLVQVLKSTAVRGYANTLAYFNQTYATKDAMNIGRLHTYLPGWAEANIAFIQSGGYAISKRIPSVQQECLVVWGRNDKILEPKYAQQFSAALPKSKLVWIEECGHCPHLEQPEALAKCIFDFTQVKYAKEVLGSYAEDKA